HGGTPLRRESAPLRAPRQGGEGTPPSTPEHSYPAPRRPGTRSSTAAQVNRADRETEFAPVGGQRRRAAASSNQRRNSPRQRRKPCRSGPMLEASESASRSPI